MTTFERRQRLIEILLDQPGLRVPELASLLGVSQGTIRNDLTALDKEGQVRRVRGGASVTSELQAQNTSFAARMRRNHTAKDIITSRAAALIEDGDSILLDASSTVFSLARYLEDRSRLRIITNGIETARAFSKNPANSVILLGGTLNMEGSTISGTLSEQFLKDLHVKTAFISCSGFHPEAGLTEVHFEEAQLKEKMIRAANRTIALVDSSKFGKVDLTAFAQVDQIAHLYTDQGLGREWIQQLQETGPAFSICSKDSVSTYNPSAPDQRHYRIGFANQSERLPFAVDVRQGLERAAKQAGNVELVLADNQLRADTAYKVARQFLSQNLDLVIEYQIDELMGNRIMNLYQSAGLPVISVDIPMIGATYFGVDNYRAGRMAGEVLGGWVRDRWNGCYDQVITLEEPRAGALPGLRIHGMLEGFQEAAGAVSPEKHLVLDSGNTYEVSEQAMMDALKQNLDWHKIAVMCFNDGSALGVLEAARKLGREQDVIIIGQGARRQVRAELAKPGSRILCSTSYSPEAYGKNLIKLALSILRGEQVPPAVYSEHVLVQAVDGTPLA